MLKIKEIRQEKGLYQKDVAKILHKTITCICDWERGRTEPSLQDLVQLADYFGVTIDELVGRENIETKNEIEKRKELRPSTLKLVDASAQLNDMGIAVVIGYIARLIEENPEFLLPSARRI